MKLTRGDAVMEKGTPLGLRPAGTVASGPFSPLFKKSIGLVYLPIAKTAVGTHFEIGIRDKKVKAAVVPTPFYKRNY
jgi:aminomethyltransferase